MCDFCGGTGVSSGSTGYNLTGGRKVDMRIRVIDTTPVTATLEMAKIQDLYGGVLVVKGWR